MIARRAVLALILASTPGAAAAAGRLLSATGTVTSGDAQYKPGDALPDSEVWLASGTATIAIDGGRFLLTGPARMTPRKSYFRLNLGSLLSVLTHRAGRRFAVRTPSVVAAVRGTDFFVEVGPTRAVDVCICDGALEVSAKGMKTLPLAAKHHLNYKFWNTKTETVGQPSPMRGHTDAELDVLRGLLAAEKP